jgi:hypothetical protein
MLRGGPLGVDRLPAKMGEFAIREGGTDGAGKSCWHGSETLHSGVGSFAQGRRQF